MKMVIQFVYFVMKNWVLNMIGLNISNWKSRNLSKILLV
ncbi:unnamed protein product [Onchocerca flexuosa]|uniref:Uncharacterized protein n=1 Tax=Onchocerca flexuosa TaxID=387005 RepID=A0A183HF43_9BILA|nr:unnamed protein product [Onchocerca flexuosa]